MNQTHLDDDDIFTVESTTVTNNNNNNNNNKINDTILQQQQQQNQLDDDEEDYEDNAGSLSSSSNNKKTISTIQQIRDRGVLLCGYAPFPGFIYPDEVTGELVGFEASLCHAIATALQVKAEFLGDNLMERYAMLALRRMDVEIHGLTHSMERTFFRSSLFAFSRPYLYTGMQAGGDPYFIQQCVEQNFKHVDECNDLMICVIGGGSTHEKTIRELVPARRIVVTGTTISDVHEAFVRGECNVMIQEEHKLGEQFVRQAGYKGDYFVGNQLYSREPLALITRSDDPEFLDFVNTVLWSLIFAEQQNITQSNAADKFPSLDLSFGSGGGGGNSSYYYNPTAFRDAVSAVGSHGELYDKFLKEYMPRNVLNQVYNYDDDDDDTNKGTPPQTGLLYAHPLGEIDNMGEDINNRSLGPKLISLLDRGYLRCGIRKDRPGLGLLKATTTAAAAAADPSSVYSGMDSDYCRALAASLFAGDSHGVVFVPIANDSKGAQLLLEGHVDVVAGAPWSLEMDIQESTTGAGFSLSQPYFYGLESNENNNAGGGSSSIRMNPICMMPRQDDPEWSAFVYWIVSSTIYAEEKGISQATSNDMPEVTFLGPGFRRMLRDAIWAVGTYSEIYARNMESILPRAAPNILNGNSPAGWGPQHYPMPGLLHFKSLDAN